MRAERWDLAHALLTCSLFIRQMFFWLQRLGARDVDQDHYDILDKPVIDACMQRLSTPPIKKTKKKEPGEPPPSEQAA
ncbi:MAG: hypothetical protein WCP28_14065 [Actinomycetes bacterium]